MIKFRFIFWSFFIMLSCSPNNKKKFISENLGCYKITPNKKYTKNITKLSDVFSSVRIVDLKNTDKNILGNINKVIFHKKSFYIMDNIYSKGVFKYDINGNFLFKFGSLGKGPSQYLGVKDICIYNNLMYILCNVNDIKIYSLENGEYLKNIKLKKSFCNYFNVSKDFIITDNHNLYNKNGENFACKIYDHEGNKINAFLNPLTSNNGVDGCLVQMESKTKVPFFKNNSYFINSYSDTLFKVGVKSITPYMIFENNKFMKPEDVKYRIIRGKLRMLNLKSDCENSIFSYCENNTKIFFGWIRNYQPLYLLYDKYKRKTLLSCCGFEPDLLIKDKIIIKPKFHFMSDSIAISSKILTSRNVNNKKIQSYDFINNNDKNLFRSDNLKLYVYSFKIDF